MTYLESLLTVVWGIGHGFFVLSLIIAALGVILALCDVAAESDTLEEAKQALRVAAVCVVYLVLMFSFIVYCNSNNYDYSTYGGFKETRERIQVIKGLEKH